MPSANEFLQKCLKKTEVCHLFGRLWFIRYQPRKAVEHHISVLNSTVMSWGNQRLRIRQPEQRTKRLKCSNVFYGVTEMRCT